MSKNLGGNDELRRQTRLTTSKLAALLIGAAVITIGIAIAYTVFRIQAIQNDKGSELTAIADGKLDQIVNWRNERLGDGLVLQSNQPFVQSLKMYEVLPTVQARTDVHNWIEALETVYSYRSYLVFDQKGNLLFNDLTSPDPIGSQTPTNVQEALISGKVLLSDLYKLNDSDEIRMDVVAPVIDHDAANSVIAVIVLRIDPYQFLYPMIGDWPIQSKSGETVLFRKEGQNLVYLNSLRFKNDSAFTLVMPIDTPKLPAGLVIKGEEGIIVGVDYRGVPVIAAGRKVPDSTWYMVTKVDTSEAYAEVRFQAWILGIAILLVLALFTIGGTSLLRKGKELYDLELVKAESATAKIRQSYEMLFELANDIIVVVDDKGIIVDVNERTVEAYGYSQAELLGMHTDVLRVKPEIRDFRTIFEYLKEQDGVRYETFHRKKSGEEFPVEVSLRHYKNEGRDYILSIVRDISERRKADNLLKDNLNALQSIIQASPLAVITTDLVGNINVWSPAAEKIFGWTESEVMGKSLLEVFQRSPEGFQVFFKNLQKAGKPLQLEREWHKKDGSTIQVSFSASFILDYHGEVSGFLGIVADVTDLKKIEAENEKMAAERLQLLKRLKLQFERIPIGFILTDENLKVLDWNPQAEKIFGFSQDEMVGKSQFDTIIPSNQKELVEEIIRKVKDKRESEIVIHENVTKDGRRIQVEWHNTSLHDENGKFMALMAMAIDVTEKFESERLLRESEQKLRLFFDSNLIGIQFADIYGQMYSANDEMLRIIGYTRKDLEEGHIHWKKMTPPEFLPLEQKAIAQALKTGEVETYEKEYIRKDGKVIWVLIGFAIIDKEAGTTIAFVLDITQKKMAEQEFMAYHKLLDLVGEIGKIGGWDFDVATGAGTWTSEVAIIHDLDPLDPTNKDLGLTFYTPESKAQIEKAIATAIEKGTPYNLELELVSASGVHKLVRTIGLPLVVDGKVERMRGIFQDVTELKQAEAEVRKLNEELEQRVIERTNELVAANQELEAFSYSVSHDLRAPLRAIDGFSKLLIDEYKNDIPPEMLRYLEMIRGNTHNMSQLIDDLLAFSRLGRQTIQRNNVDIVKLVQGVVEKVKLEVQGREVEFVIKKLSDCHADDALLAQVYYNLISNAVKFTRVRAKAVIEIGSKKTIPRMSDGSTRPMTECYYVSDNGVGFDMRYYDKLFSVFQRLHKAEEYEGTGVGLAIVKRVIDKHGGLVWADSTPGSGSTFYFTIGKEESNDQSS
ncbi:MAG: PAS domain S-box protein [Anaerolineaceae bacterium]|nr:PAS domain S-box protein [Anaerolineaceae bacterium]